MKKHIRILLLLVLMLSITTMIASAQTEAVIPTCPDGLVEGTVVDIDDETGQLIVDVEGSLCALAPPSGDYDHPVTSLLGAFFSTEFNLEGISTALENTEVCLVDDGLGGWLIEEPAEGEECSGTLAKVVGQAEDGSFLVAMGEEVFPLVVDDETKAGALSEALEALALSVEIAEGAMSDAGDKISAYHDDGYGFGVLVKVYAIASEAQKACLASAGEVETEADKTGEPEESEGIDPCSITAEHLIGELENMGMGQIFKLYGKPEIMGVGHVRKLMGTTGDADGDGAGEGHDTSGVCNARAHGGNANANGQPDITCEEAAPKVKDKKDKKDK
jgi:hypothetical protein